MKYKKTIKIYENFFELSNKFKVYKLVLNLNIKLHLHENIEH